MIFFPCAELALIRGQITGMKSIPQCAGLSRAINTTVQCGGAGGERSGRRGFAELREESG